VASDIQDEGQSQTSMLCSTTEARQAPYSLGTYCSVYLLDNLRSRSAILSNLRSFTGTAADFRGDNTSKVAASSSLRSQRQVIVLEVPMERAGSDRRRRDSAGMQTRRTRCLVLMMKTSEARMTQG
jgi:hypothetical protein